MDKAICGTSNCQLNDIPPKYKSEHESFCIHQLTVKLANLTLQTDSLSSNARKNHHHARIDSSESVTIIYNKMDHKRVNLLAAVGLLDLYEAVMSAKTSIGVTVTTSVLTEMENTASMLVLMESVCDRMDSALLPGVQAALLESVRNNVIQCCLENAKVRNIDEMEVFQGFLDNFYDSESIAVTAMESLHNTNESGGTTRQITQLSTCLFKLANNNQEDIVQRLFMIGAVTYNTTERPKGKVYSMINSRPKQKYTLFTHSKKRSIAFYSQKEKVLNLKAVPNLKSIVFAKPLSKKVDFAKLSKKVKARLVKMTSYQQLFLQLLKEFEKVMYASDQKQGYIDNVSRQIENQICIPEHEDSDRMSSLVATEESQQHTETMTYDSSTQAGISSDEQILHMDVNEFAARINEEIDQIAESDPMAEPHDVVRYALGHFLQNSVLGEKEDHRVLYTVDGEDQSVAVCTESTLLCHIDGAAVKKLGSDTKTGGAEGFEHFLKESANRVHDGRTTNSDTQSYGQTSGESDDEFLVTNRNKVPHRRKNTYTGYRIRYKGQHWTKEDDQLDKFQTTIKKRKHPSKKKFVKLSTNNGPIRKSIHVVSAEESSSDSNSDNASDVVSLTDFCSVCSTDSYRQ